MAELYGKRYSRAELLKHVGDISQVARVKPYRLIEGPEDGVQALDVTNGSGLDFTVLAGRGMDISAASYNGRSLAWRSPTSDVHASYFDHEGEDGFGWLRSFFGGLVITCGLTYAGNRGVDEGTAYGLHGRVSNTPASNVAWSGHWEGDDYVLTVSGKVRQTRVFGENIEMTRRITTRLGTPSFVLSDTVENLDYKRTEHMLLYHINVGFPAIGEHARLIAPTLNATPRDADAQAAMGHLTEMEEPQAGFSEQCYFHEFAADPDGKVTTALVNPDCPAGAGTEPGYGVYCSYRPEQFPRFIEWKMMGAGTYVCGMEPANCLVMGRAAERERGSLQFLEPGEKREYSVEIGVLAGPEAISAVERRCQAAVAAHRS